MLGGGLLPGTLCVVYGATGTGTRLLSYGAWSVSYTHLTLPTILRV